VKPGSFIVPHLLWTQRCDPHERTPPRDVIPSLRHIEVTSYVAPGVTAIKIAQKVTTTPPPTPLRALPEARPPGPPGHQRRMRLGCTADGVALCRKQGIPACFGEGMGTVVVPARLLQGGFCGKSWRTHHVHLLPGRSLNARRKGTSWLPGTATPR
jgi:hypothetical protein